MLLWYSGSLSLSCYFKIRYYSDIIIHQKLIISFGGYYFRTNIILFIGRAKHDFIIYVRWICLFVIYSVAVMASIYASTSLSDRIH